jgi:hypothetical protein
MYVASILGRFCVFGMKSKEPEILIVFLNAAFCTNIFDDILVKKSANIF